LLVFVSTGLFLAGFLVWEILDSIDSKWSGAPDVDRRAQLFIIYRMEKLTHARLL
jgi:hypothetical protein